MPCQHTEIGVVVQNGRIGANGNRADETIYQPANSLPFPATDAIQSGRILIVQRPCGKNGRTREQPAQVHQMPFVTRPGEYFHPNCIADRDLAFE